MKVKLTITNFTKFEIPVVLFNSAHNRNAVNFGNPYSDLVIKCEFEVGNLLVKETGTGNNYQDLLAMTEALKVAAKLINCDEVFDALPDFKCIEHGNFLEAKVISTHEIALRSINLSLLTRMEFTLPAGKTVEMLFNILTLE